MSYLFQNHFTFFFCVFFNILFDNVIAIRFTWSLVKYHNCFITIFLKKKNRKDVSIQTLLAVKTCSYILLFMLNCMRLLNPRSLIKCQSPKETDEISLFLKSIIKRINKSYTYSETPSFIMLHWETSTSELSWSFFFCIAPSIRVKFSLSSVYSLLFFPCRAL